MPNGRLTCASAKAPCRQRLKNACGRLFCTTLHQPPINQLSGEMAGSIDEHYRVYCLGPDPNNLLMWSQYADSHCGICLEFSLTWARNSVLYRRRRRRPGSSGAEVSLSPPRMRWTASCPCRTIRWVANYMRQQGISGSKTDESMRRRPLRIVGAG